MYIRLVTAIASDMELDQALSYESQIGHIAGHPTTTTDMNTTLTNTQLTTPKIILAVVVAAKN